MRKNFAKTCLLLITLFSPAVAQTNLETKSVQNKVHSEQGQSAAAEQEPERQAEEFLALEIFRLTNEARRECGLSNLVAHQALQGAAYAHSREMRTLNYFSHQSPTSGRETARKRVQQFGLNPQMVAENIFECSGYDLHQVARIAVESLLNSPPHRKNIMSSTTTHMGVGVYQVEGSISITQVFAAGI